MSEEHERATKSGRWREFAAIGAALVLAFFVGTFFGGGDDAPEGHDHAQAEPAQQTWTCSMHPQIQQGEAGDCPICGMDLIPVSESGGGEALAPNEIALSDRAKALAQIRTTRVSRAGGEAASVHLLGIVKEAETGEKVVAARTGGRIDRLHVKTTGERIRRGQKIATIYSPEIYAAHQDLLAATAQLADLQDGQPFARRSAEGTLASARQKLRLLGVPEAEIGRMEKASKPATSVPIRSPFGGTVTRRLVSEGNYISPGTGLYQVSDLSTVWVQLDAYERDLGMLDKEQKVELEFNAYPGESFEGTIAFIDPVLNPRTRTAEVRVEVPNPEGRLRPGMFAEAIVERKARGNSPLVIPETAAIFTGKRSIVYVEVPRTDRPTYASREVRLGPKIQGQYPVVAGLNEGEWVVTHGAFTLDADLQIRGGKSMMSYPDDSQASAIDNVVEAPEDFMERLEPIVVHYLEMQEGLAADDLQAALDANTSLLAKTIEFDPEAPAAAVAAWKPIRREILRHARAIETASSLESARGPFEPLTEQITSILRIFGNPTDGPLRKTHCPMAFDDRGASWIQRGEKVDNAYFGASMRMCGSIEQTIPSGGHLVERVAE